ncbi:MAG: hypothetical protein R8J94_03825 [Acidimicrobiia bacterium]|nr:hypothetical protein [Acidimicrobiia bacterium]
MKVLETFKSWGQLGRKPSSALLLLVGAILVGACGGSSTTEATADLETPIPETTDTTMQTESDDEHTAGEPVGDAGWVIEVASNAAALWSEDADLVQRVDLLAGTDAVDRLQRQFEDESEIVSGLGGQFPPSSPAEYESTYQAFLTALDDWSAAATSGMQAIDERGGDLQDELNLMGDDIGQIMEASGASDLQRQVFTARDAAIDACFDLQTATQAIEPVIVCSDATPVPELVGDRIKVETFPPFTMAVDDPDSVLLLPEGVNVGGNGNFVISSAVQLADPDGTYSEMAITPIVPPDELQAWIDATTVISVVDQGTMSVAEHDSRWWTITGNGEGLEIAGSSFVGIFAYDGRDIPQQIGTSDMITIWEIPHPDATVYVFVNNPRELFLDEVRGVLETIAFDV